MGEDAGSIFGLADKMVRGSGWPECGGGCNYCNCRSVIEERGRGQAGEGAGQYHCH